jgi:cullin 1
MKARKRMGYQELAIEVAAQVKSRFSPKDADMARSVDLLVRKEFLERLEDGCVAYLA